MTKVRLQEFRNMLDNETYITAYLILITEIEETGKTDEIIQLSKELSNKVRGKAYLYASKKADHLAIEMESLLKLNNRINGEGIYN